MPICGRCGKMQSSAEIGAVLYLALDTSGDWARSEFPDELITFDFNSKGELIGVEAIGSAAQAGIDALVKALTKDTARCKERAKALEQVMGRVK